VRYPHVFVLYADRNQRAICLVLNFPYHLTIIPAKAGIHRQYEAWIPAFAHCCPEKISARVTGMAKCSSSQRKLGSSDLQSVKGTGSQLSLDDESVALNFLKKFVGITLRVALFLRASFSPGSNGRSPDTMWLF
jgi:hypothetical protein